MTNLSKFKIIECMERTDISNRLVISPLLNKELQLADGAVDVRLGTQFIIIKRTEFMGLDPKDRLKIKERIRNYQEMVRVKFQYPFILHPNHLVLGSTLEYISIPNDLSAYVLTRSSWGRLGLIIATATYINSGYKGCLTLEIENIGEVPLALYPGTRVAQLVLNRLDGVGEYQGSYKCPTGPEFSKAHEDKELEFWASENNKP